MAVTFYFSVALTARRAARLQSACTAQAMVTDVDIRTAVCGSITYNHVRHVDRLTVSCISSVCIGQYYPRKRCCCSAAPS